MKPARRARPTVRDDTSLHMLPGSTCAYSRKNNWTTAMEGAQARTSVQYTGLYGGLLPGILRLEGHSATLWDVGVRENCSIESGGVTGGIFVSQLTKQVRGLTGVIFGPRWKPVRVVTYQTFKRVRRAQE